MSRGEDPTTIWLFSLNLLVIAFMILLWGLQRDQTAALQRIEERVQYCAVSGR